MRCERCGGQADESVMICPTCGALLYEQKRANTGEQAPSERHKNGMLLAGVLATFGLLAGIVRLAGHGRKTFADDLFSGFPYMEAVVLAGPFLMMACYAAVLAGSLLFFVKVREGIKIVRIALALLLLLNIVVTPLHLFLSHLSPLWDSLAAPVQDLFSLTTIGSMFIPTLIWGYLLYLLRRATTP